MWMVLIEVRTKGSSISSSIITLDDTPCILLQENRMIPDSILNTGSIPVQDWWYIPSSLNQHPPVHHPLDVRNYSTVDEHQVS